MGGKCDHVGIAQRGGISAGDDHTGHVSDIGHEVSPHPVGDLAELDPVRHARIRGVSGDDQPGPVFQRQFFDFVIVQQLRLRVDAVRNDVIELAGQVDRAAVGQVSPVRKGHAHDGVARLEQRLLNGDVGRSAG